MADTPSLAASDVLQELRAHGVTDVVGLPDNSSAALFALLAAGDRIRLRTVTREGEAFALAAGLWMGGAEPVVLIQNTGLLESGDSLRGTAMRMRIPLVCLVTYRGGAKMMRALGGVPAALDGDLLSRPDLDSTALVTEPTLAAWGLVFDRLSDAGDLPKIRRALDLSRDREMPVALLITRDLA
jgi:sulfopyruvate decarboxylase TPP-binding subunit